MYIVLRHNKILDYCEEKYICVGPTVICQSKEIAFDCATFVEVDSVPTDINQYDYFYIEGNFVKEDKKIWRNKVLASENVDYAEIGEWSDSNPDNENRIGYFICLDLETSGVNMRKAGVEDDVRGVTVTMPAFSSNATSDKFDNSGNLLQQYDYVAVMGLVSVIDNGTCSVNARCMPANDGTAVPSTNNMGYHVIDRIDDTHILISVEPGADMLNRIKTDIVDLQEHKVSCSVPMTMSVNEQGGLVISYDNGQ